MIKKIFKELAENIKKNVKSEDIDRKMEHKKQSIDRIRKTQEKYAQKNYTDEIITPKTVHIEKINDFCSKKYEYCYITFPEDLDITWITTVGNVHNNHDVYWKHQEKLAKQKAIQEL